MPTASQWMAKWLTYDRQTGNLIKLLLCAVVKCCVDWISLLLAAFLKPCGHRFVAPTVVPLRWWNMFGESWWSWRFIANNGAICFGACWCKAINKKLETIIMVWTLQTVKDFTPLLPKASLKTIYTKLYGFHFCTSPSSLIKFDLLVYAKPCWHTDRQTSKQIAMK